MLEKIILKEIAGEIDIEVNKKILKFGRSKHLEALRIYLSLV